MPKLLDTIDHRPYPLPDRPWLMFQRWEKLLFAHWAVHPEVLAPYIPSGLSLDIYGGQAWVGVVPFSMHRIHPRYLPPVPWLSAFLELNVRTYVIHDGKPGVWFFSLDAANPLAVSIARRFYHLPYFNAAMSLKRQGDTITYRSSRTHRGAAAGVFAGRYRPISAVLRAETNSLEAFLTERYCLYTEDRRGTLYRGEIHHEPWPLQQAEAELDEVSVPPFALPNTEPLLHYAQRLDVLVWALEKLR